MRDVEKPLCGGALRADSDELATLHCPECGMEYAHFQGVVGIADQYGPLSLFRCEGGHWFVLGFSGHAGVTWLYSDGLPGFEEKLEAYREAETVAPGNAGARVLALSLARREHPPSPLP
jgi:hypothetical protein